MSVIVLGSNHTRTAEYYKKLGLSESTLITTVDHGCKVGHTCIQDVPDLLTLELILKNADTVYWAEPNKDEFFSDDSYYDFLDWLKDYNLKYQNVKNFSSIKFDPYGWTNEINVNLNQMVFLGCSFTRGSGLSDANTHYATIVANHFDKEPLNLGHRGGSNGLIFDMFSQLDFNPGQLVVVQLTPLSRLRYCYPDKKLDNILLASPKDQNLNKAMLEVYHKDFLFYELLVKVRAMVTIARLKKLKMVFWLVDYKNEGVYSKLDQTYFYNMKEYVPASWMENYIVDAAEDNQHPGVESNKKIAHSLINYIETIYEC